MLLAALLALTGGAAWAEEFPSITVTGAMTVDLETARNAGMDCISVTWGFRDEPQLLDAGAATLVHTPKELEGLLLDA